MVRAVVARAVVAMRVVGRTVVARIVVAFTVVMRAVVAARVVGYQYKPNQCNIRKKCYNYETEARGNKRGRSCTFRVVAAFAMRAYSQRMNSYSRRGNLK